MSTGVSENIKIKVHSQYMQSHSSPSKREFYYGYHITILNLRQNKVQLLSRHWYIFDSNGTYKEVTGEGVIGKQPIIMPSESHEYNSYSFLTTDFGKMWGTFLMKDLENDQLFEVKIPEFELAANFRLN